ncbi:MAG TPA: hypothetical protein VFH35_10085 [Ramlibacter sp.]|nr:hypothetical protein [Ramlibacter sp.]
MRIKQTLTGEHVLVAPDGARLSVTDLLNTRPRDNQFQPNRSGSFSLVQATYSAALVERSRSARRCVLPFKGEIEARVQSDVLRLAGRFRQGLGWREDRVKLPLKDIVHARVRSSLVDLWMRLDGQEELACFTLELFSPEAAGEFVDWLPAATPWPQPQAATAKPAEQAGGNPLVWVAVVGTAVTVGGVVVLLFARI